MKNTTQKRRGGAAEMPPDTRLLYTAGMVTPADARRLGCKVMGCARCDQETTLIRLGAPISGDELDSQGGVLPGLKWGEDVLVMCPCCSGPGCPHREPDRNRMAAVPFHGFGWAAVRP